MQSGGTKRPNKLASALATFLVFVVVGGLVGELFENLVIYWDACTNSFPNAGIVEIAGLAVRSAFQNVTLNYEQHVVNIPMIVSGLAAAITGVRTGEPSIRVIGVVWIVGTLFIMGGRYFVSGDVFAVYQYVILLVAGAIVALACWSFSKFFWY
jgi:hypothetical protein